MARIHVGAAAVIQARPEEVYSVLADYHNHHPHILPKQFFSGLQVEEGGIGAGTVIRVRVRALGVEREYHMVVAEPEPGRVLTETDMQSGLVTTFTLTPAANGQTHVKIASDWESSSGFAGLMDRLITPGFMRRSYAQELAQLATYLENRSE